MNATDERIIVVARLVDDIEVTDTAGHDLGRRPKVRQIRRVEAAVWLNRGILADVERAKVWARENGYDVVCFPTTEKDPLGAVRRAATKV